ncbi:unnamed protein product [Arctogadus glacialis]
MEARSFSGLLIGCFYPVTLSTNTGFLLHLLHALPSHNTLQTKERYTLVHSNLRSTADVTHTANPNVQRITHIPAGKTSNLTRPHLMSNNLL